MNWMTQKQQKVMFSQFWRLGVWDQGTSPVRCNKRLSLVCSVLTQPYPGVCTHTPQAPSVSSNSGMDPIGLGPCSRDLVCFPKAPSPNAIMWRVRAATHEFGGRGHNLVHSNLFILICQMRLTIIPTSV